MPKRGAGSGKADEPEKRKGKLANISEERVRRIYLTYRMPELLSALEKLAGEVQALTDKLNDTAVARGSRERSEAEERLIYLRAYRPVLMEELESLKKEHKRMAREAG